MAVMLSPFTGTRFTVRDENVGKRIELGYRLVEGGDARPCTEDDAADICADDVPEAPKMPDEGSTIAEIREYAKAVGVKLPRSGSKADLLAALQ